MMTDPERPDGPEPSEPDGSAPASREPRCPDGPRAAGARLAAAAAALARLPHASPRIEAELLLTLATGWPRTQILAWPERPLDTAADARFSALLARRLAGEPIAYLRGTQAFWTFELSVTPATLIPRPETELLVEILLERCPAQAPLRIADLGTGSGAIAAALASERPAWRILATDVSAAALGVARANLQALGLDGRVGLARARWLDAIASGALDAIVANPPYVAADDPHLTQGDPRFEPVQALTPGGDGLDAIRAIAAAAPDRLRPGGPLLVEHGFDQGAEVRAILAAAGLREVETRADLAGLERATLGVRR